MKLTVDVSTTVSASIQVEISDERLIEIASELGVEIEALTVDDLTDEIYSVMETPKICAQCSGWGENWSMNLGDEWEITDDPKETNPEYRGIRIAK